MTKIECHRNTVQQVINKMEREHSKSSCSQSIYKFNKKVGTPEVGNGNQLQYSCLENSMDSGAWQAKVHGVTKESGITERLNMDNFIVVKK